MPWREAGRGSGRQAPGWRSRSGVPAQRTTEPESPEPEADVTPRQSPVRPAGPIAGLPPGPAAPWALQTIHWIRSPFAYMRAAAARHGDSFTARLGSGGQPILFLSAPEDLRILLSGDEGEPFEAPGELNALFEPFLGTESVIGISGERHRRMRRLLMPPFHGERMRSYGDTILRITEEVVDNLPARDPFTLQRSMQTLSMRVILSTVFGLREGKRYRKLERLLAALLDRMSGPASVSLLYFPFLRLDLGRWSPWGRSCASGRRSTPCSTRRSSSGATGRRSRRRRRHRHPLAAAVRPR